MAPRCDVESHPEPPPVKAFASGAKPAVFVVDARERQSDWLARTVLLLERFPSTPVVVLAESGRSAVTRFELGERCFVLECPFRLPTLLDLVCAALPCEFPSPAWHDARTAAVIDAVCQDYARFHLRKVAERLGMSPYQLSRRFREYAGLPLGIYVRLVKVRAAEFLLARGARKLQAVAAAVGFHDASHLSRVFVKLTGHRPGQLRLNATPDGRFCAVSLPRDGQALAAVVVLVLPRAAFSEA